VQVEASTRKADLVVSGRIASSGVLSKADRVDAISGWAPDQHHVVHFDVDAVKKGAWPHADLGVLVHSPFLAFFPHSDVGDRHLLFFTHLTTEDGEGLLHLEESRPCVPVALPCGL
jgi:hypothetical protein